jgi:hypothetical protein
MADWDVQNFVVSKCLRAGRTAIRRLDWDIETVFCGEQLPFGWSVNGPMVGLECPDFVLW